MPWTFDPERIRLAREVADMSQSELAAKIGATQNQVSQWERGTITPGQKMLVKICDVTGAPPKFFFVSSASSGAESKAA